MAVIVGDIVAVILDVVFEIRSCFLADPVPPSSVLFVLEWGAGFRSVIELDRRPGDAGVGAIEIEIFEVERSDCASPCASSS
ncbi:hypothetical protein [Halobacteriaceae bacterium SHR40]|uniref:hypothetical protein n=1 Tax=Halovenus amylolytica TaxID=2500550 RepID=UPI000FE3D7BA